MPSNTPPVRDIPLLTWTQNFDARVQADLFHFGVGAARAAALHAAALAYAAALAVALDPGTRTRAAVAEKDRTRLVLLREARQCCRIINANLDVDDAARALLGLPPRPAGAGPLPAPAMRPLLSVDSKGNLRLVSADPPLRRGKPRGVFGAVLFMRVGPADEPAPLAPRDYWYAGIATRPRHQLELPADADGLTLWVMARYVGERGQEGPMSAPVRTTVAL